MDLIEKFLSSQENYSDLGIRDALHAVDRDAPGWLKEQGVPDSDIPGLVKEAKKRLVQMEKDDLDRL